MAKNSEENKTLNTSNYVTAKNGKQGSGCCQNSSENATKKSSSQGKAKNKGSAERAKNKSSNCN